MKKLAKAIDKLVSGEAAELADRAREEWTKLQERRRYANGDLLFTGECFREIFCPQFLNRYRTADGTIDLVTALRATERPRFYPGFRCIEGFATFVEQSGSLSKAQIVTIANRIFENRVSIFGNGSYSLGSPPVWHRDPYTGVEAPATFYDDVRYLDAREVGDSRAVWELSRLQFVYDLGNAYLLTGDPRYSRKFFDLLRYWLSANPPYHGINYCSALEFAFRANSVLWAIHYFRHSEEFSQGDAYDCYRLLFIAADFIEHHLSRHFSPNTHLLGEGWALFVIGLMMPEFRHAAEWRRLGREILVEESTRQFLRDGMHSELSVSYHAYAVEFLLTAAILGEVNDCEFPEGYSKVLDRSVGALAVLQLPDGCVPHVGDEDGGRLLYLSGSAANDYRPLLEAARGWLQKARGGHPMCDFAETFFLLGKRQQQTAAGVREQREVFCLPDAGYFVSRVGAEYSLLQAGAFGYRDAPHSHADMLHIEISVGRDNFIIDPGTAIYTGDLSRRNRYRSWQSHNGPHLKSFVLEDRDDPFGWQQKPGCSLTSAVYGRASSFCCAATVVRQSHYANARLQRTLVHLYGAGWWVIDQIELDRDAEVAWKFVSPYPMRAMPSGCIISGNDSALFIGALSLSEKSLRLRVGAAEYSSRYLTTSVGSVFAADLGFVKQAAVAWRMLPAKTNVTPEVTPRLAVSVSQSCVCLQYHYADRSEQLIMGKDKWWGIDDIESDAALALVCRQRSKTKTALMIDGTRLVTEKELRIDCKQIARFTELSIDESQAVLCTDAGVDVKCTEHVPLERDKVRRAV